MRDRHWQDEATIVIGVLADQIDTAGGGAEDLKLLNQSEMQQSPQFQNTKAQFPNVSVWPGDRDGTTWPNSNPNSEGGVSFTLGYPLINGCHACERAGFAEFNWKFGPTGKFLGTTFMGMTPPPEH